MSEEDDSQKTEEPTQKKLDDARKKGQVPLSREVNHWVMIFAGVILVATASPGVFSGLTNFLGGYIENAHDYPSMPGGFGTILGDAFGKTMAVVSIVFAAMMIAAFIGPFTQVGPLFSPESIKPKLEKISIKKGFGRLFSKNSLMEFFKGLLKIVAIATVGFVIVAPYFTGLEHMVGLPMGILLEEILFIVVKMLTGILVVLLIVAVIDLSFQRKQHTEQMKMSKQEVKDEHKQTEGDPHVKGKLRQLRAEKGRQRMMQAIPEADVVITNPTHFAIALKYNPDETPAPICVAKGVDELALRIRETAQEHGVEVVENKPLARALYDVIEVDQMIPTEHFQAVAEIISYVFKLKGKI